MGDGRLISKRVWERLEGDASVGPGHLRQRIPVDAPVDVYVAVEKPSGSRVLALGFDEPPHTSLAQAVQLRGLRVSEAPFAMEQKPWTVSIATSRAEDNQIFGELADDLVSVVAASSTGDQASDALAVRLECWHRFLDHSGSNGLSPEAQVGLYGELWCLRELLTPAVAVAEAVRSWRGPLGGAQDFQGAGWSVEVKASRQLAPATVRISNERQLDAPKGFLSLLVVGLEERSHSPETLPEIVASIRASVVNAPGASPAFEDRLLSAGYLDVQADRYVDTGFTVRHVAAYAVGDTFPRIIEQMLPAGVGKVAYDLSLDACEPYRMAVDQFQKQIAAAVK
jgi:hypothetical protein